MKLAFVLGTRPEIIKTSPVIRAAERAKVPFLIIHSGQHYSYEMDKVFFEELRLPKADYNLEVGSGPHGAMTARILERLEPILIKERPDCVLVQGDTNTVMAGALCAVKLHIPIGHIEAGLRSYDRGMPEEHNRIIADHLSDLLFCPTKEAARIARGEGIPRARLFVTGNTAVDAVLHHVHLALKTGGLNTARLTPQGYILVTAHRPENVDRKETLVQLLKSLEAIGQAVRLPLYWPIHPRTEKQLERYHLKLSQTIRIVPPVGFLEFLELEAEAALIATDSGGIQEEACILRVPCLTLRENTERPETVAVGGNVLIGLNPGTAARLAKIMINKPRRWRNPFGDGRAGERIVEVLKRKLKLPPRKYARNRTEVSVSFRG